MPTIKVKVGQVLHNPYYKSDIPAEFLDWWVRLLKNQVKNDPGEPPPCEARPAPNAKGKYEVIDHRSNGFLEAFRKAAGDDHEIPLRVHDDIDDEAMLLIAHNGWEVWMYHAYVAKQALRERLPIQIEKLETIVNDMATHVSRKRHKKAKKDKNAKKDEKAAENAERMEKFKREEDEFALIWKFAECLFTEVNGPDPERGLTLRIAELEERLYHPEHFYPHYPPEHCRKYLAVLREAIRKLRDEGGGPKVEEPELVLT